MRSWFVAALAVSLLAGALAAPPAAEAQTCQWYGTTMYCSNGLSSQRYGNTTYYSNGVVRQDYGDTSYYSGGPQQSQNQTFTFLGNNGFTNRARENVEIYGGGCRGFSGPRPCN